MQAYLLAAGRGRRAGGPKAWLTHHGKPLLERQLDFALGQFAARDVAVSIQEAWLARCEPLAPGARFIAVDPDSSPLASLQALLREHPASSPFFVWHVDQPVWDRGLFDALSSRIRDAGRGHTMVDHSMRALEGARPVVGGKGRHPVLLMPELGLRILALNPVSERLDHWLRGREIADVPAGAACCVEDWNGGVPA